MKKRRIKNLFPELDEKFPGSTYYDWYGKRMTLGQWASMVESQIQAVDYTYLRRLNETYRVSTVLLGIDYSFGQSKQPQIFETFVWTPQVTDVISRYATLEQARKGHRKTVRYFREMINHERKIKRILHNGRKP